MIIAVDIGFGFVKVMNDYGAREMFPSVLAKRPEQSFRGIIGGGGDDFSITYWEGNGEERNNERKYYVGDAAMSSSGTRKWEDKDKFNNDELKVFIATAVGLVNPSNEDADLVVGLPMSHYMDKKDELVNILGEIDAHVEFVSRKGIRKTRFKTISCFPQGAGAYYSATLDIHGKVKDHELLNSNVGVIDIGYRTVDFLAMVKGRKGIVINDNLTGSLEEDGMNKAFLAMERIMSERVGREVGLMEIEKAIFWFGSKLDYRGEAYHLVDIEEQAYTELADNIAAKIKQKWGTEGDTLSKVIITGGGGEALFPVLGKKFAQAELQENAAYANCEGYLGVQAFRQRKATGEKIAK